LKLEVPVPETPGLKTVTHKEQFCNIWYDEPLEECEAKFKLVINMEQSGKCVENSFFLKKWSMILDKFYLLYDLLLIIIQASFSSAIIRSLSF
jgi:hypothetical protein